MYANYVCGCVGVRAYELFVLCFACLCAHSYVCLRIDLCVSVRVYVCLCIDLCVSVRVYMFAGTHYPRLLRRVHGERVVCAWTLQQGAGLLLFPICGREKQKGTLRGVRNSSLILAHFLGRFDGTVPLPARVPARLPICCCFRVADVRIDCVCRCCRWFICKCYMHI